jgi:AcrR family transcriptional regulator
MNKADVTVKERILKVTMDLLQREQDIDRVSLRQIAREAGVAVSMVNYHYQTKASLIEQAVQAFAGSVIATSASEDKATRMRSHLAGAASFIVQNSGIARVSILRDMSNPHSDDNTCNVTELVHRQMTESNLDRNTKTDQELYLRAVVQVAAVQHLFLRSRIIQERTGLDFADPEQREQLLDGVLAITTGGNTE